MTIGSCARTLSVPWYCAGLAIMVLLRQSGVLAFLAAPTNSMYMLWKVSPQTQKARLVLPMLDLLLCQTPSFLDAGLNCCSARYPPAWL